MTVTINGTTGIANDGGYTGDGVVFADTTPANTLVTTTSGNVGIGTSSPALVYSDDTTLTVNGKQSATSYRSALELGNNGSLGAFYFCSTANAVLGSYANIPLAFRTNNTERARIDTSGNLLVGTTSTASYGAGIGKLYLSANGANWQVGPTSAFANFYIKAGTGYGVGMTTTATSWSSDSDERKKTALTPFANAAEKVCSLRAGTGRYLTDEENMSRSFLIAQDVQAVLPEAVDVGEDEDQSLMLRYTDLIPLLTAAIQEQQAMIASQSEIITALTARVTALDTRLTSLEGTQP